MNPIPTSTAVQFQLPNGIRLIVEPDHSAPVATLQAWINAGSITEEHHLGAGLSHILEHMLFKGTQRRGNSEIAQTVQSLGGYMNAYTTFDRTVYYIDLPAKGWKTGLDVLADMIFHSTLPEDEYAKEQEVIRREFAMGFDDPGRTLQKLLFETAFQVHPYRFPVIGHLEIYNQLTRQQVLDYYHRFYVPDNVTFIVVGDVDPTEVRDELQRLTAAIPRRSAPEVFIPQEPRQLGRREAHQPFPTEAARLYMSFHIPGVTNPDMFPLDVLAQIAGQGNSSRLYRELVQRRNLLQDVSAFSYTPAQSGLWGIAATFRPDSPITIPQAEADILAILNQFKTRPVTPAELAKAKRQALVAKASERKTVAGRAASLGSAWFNARDLGFPERYLRGIEQVTAEDILRVARTYLNSDNLTVVSLYPKNQQPPSGASDTLTSSRQNLTSVTLDNGAPLVLLPDDKIPLVTLRVVGRGGILTETPANNGISQLVARLLDKGTPTRTAEQIAEEIESLGGSLTSDTGNNSFTLAIEVLRSDLPAAMNLFADILLHASFPEDEFLKERDRQLGEIRLELDQPMALARNALRPALFGDHPYAMNSLGTPATLATLTPDDLRAHHRRLFQAENIVFSIAGSFEPAEAIQLFNRAFPARALPRGTPAYQPQAPDFRGTGQTVVVPTPKQQAIVQIGYPGISISNPDRPALELIDEALSDLASRLFIRIRERQSLAYFVGTGQMIGFDPGVFIFYAGTEASKAELVVREMLDEIRTIVQQGLDPAEFERARAKLLGKRLLQDQAAPAVAYKAALNLLYGLGLHHEAELVRQIEQLDSPTVQEAARRYFSKPDFVTIIVQPEPKPDRSSPAPAQP
ncbi:MAG: pitrilysin family protein [Verrucomicrobiia bacterium]